MFCLGSQRLQFSCAAELAFNSQTQRTAVVRRLVGGPLESTARRDLSDVKPALEGGGLCICLAHLQDEGAKLARKLIPEARLHARFEASEPLSISGLLPERAFEDAGDGASALRGEIQRTFSVECSI